jgi:transcriptional regulator with XRE-family HTH domain
MGKAGQALNQVLETYGISQNRLAVAMEIRRSHVNRWVNEMADPAADAVLEIRDRLEKINLDAADAVLEIRDRLEKINLDAAEEFIRLYLGKSTQDD